MKVFKSICIRLLTVGLIFLATGLTAQQTASITVRGVCGMCQERIEKAALTVKGVRKANYNISEQLLTVEVSEPFDVNELHLAMTKVGHDTGALTASDEAYDKVHDCCKYREMDIHAPPSEEEPPTPEKGEQELSPFITGHIYEKGEGGANTPLIGVNIVWKGAPSGVVTDLNGAFEIGRISAADELVISYVGYSPDTVDMSDRSSLEWVMSNDVVLDEVEVTHRKQTTEVSKLDAIQTINMSEEELCKAACCNLSESFETSPAVDVSFTDAVTGTRQIQMLGLAGKYVQITRELIPDIRGLSTIFGLTYTPGAWIQSIQLSKGSGSVANGHEGMTGQINVELRKPRADEDLYLNLYANEGGRYEGNLFTRHKINQRWSTAVLLHGSTRDRRFDRNDDGFLDSPLGRDFIAVNRWKYQNKNGWQGQLGFKVNHINRTGGELRFNADTDELSNEIWGSVNETRRYEAWMKLGKVFSEELNQSFGLQVSAMTHDQDLNFGLREYDGSQNNLFANLIFQSDLGSSAHTIKTGVSFVADNYEEHIFQRLYDRNENIIGAYGEYTVKANELLTIVAGLRGDHHNRYGFMPSPRLHVRMAASETYSTVFRITAGKGWRTANIFAENIGILASGRAIQVVGTNEDNPYNLQPEESWNFGANITQDLFLFGKAGTITLDYYYTLFDHQIVADMESSGDGTVILTNQPEATDGHSIQSQIDIEVLDKLDVRLAYRYNYSEASFGGETKSIALTPFHRAFANLAYEAPGQWHFDVTVNWRGEQRLPATDWLEPEDQLDEMAPDFVTVNAQVRKIFRDNFELYVGGENVLNFTQESPIINPQTPFANDFDASLVWGPIFGRNIYAGLRYRLK